MPQPQYFERSYFAAFFADIMRSKIYQMSLTEVKNYIVEIKPLNITINKEKRSFHSFIEINA